MYWLYPAWESIRRTALLQASRHYFSFSTSLPSVQRLKISPGCSKVGSFHHLQRLVIGRLNRERVTLSVLGHCSHCHCKSYERAYLISTSWSYHRIFCEGSNLLEIPVTININHKSTGDWIKSQMEPGRTSSATHTVTFCWVQSRRWPDSLSCQHRWNFTLCELLTFCRIHVFGRVTEKKTIMQTISYKYLINIWIM